MVQTVMFQGEMDYVQDHVNGFLSEDENDRKLISIQHSSFNGDGRAGLITVILVGNFKTKYNK